MKKMKKIKNNKNEKFKKIYVKKKTGGKSQEDTNERVN